MGHGAERMGMVGHTLVCQLHGAERIVGHTLVCQEHKRLEARSA